MSLGADLAIDDMPTADAPVHGLVLLEIDDFGTIEDLYGESLASGIIFCTETCLWPLLPDGSGTWHAARGQFAISMPNTSERALTALAEGLQQAVAANTHHTPQGPVSITASAGVAIAAADRLTELGPAARRALSAAQSGGRGRLATRRTGEDGVATLQRRAERAIYRGAIQMVFLPVHAAYGTGPIAWRECLVRLPNDGAAQVPAADFVPHLSATGHIAALDRLILKRAAALLAGRPLLRLSINLGAGTLSADGFLERLASLARNDAGLVGRLILEIRAPDAIADPARAAGFIDRVRGLSAAVAFDGICAEPEASAQDERMLLSRFRPDFVKIPFTDQVKSPVHRSALIAEALDSDIGVVASHVDSTTQLITAKALGAHYLQGWAVATAEDTLPRAAEADQPTAATPVAISTDTRHTNVG
ncbi:MAG: GGDEF domain-containing protein [Pseudomonadota bacterium]